MQKQKGVDSGNPQRMPVRSMPVPLTAARIGDHVLIDPSAEEEACMDSRIKITTTDEGFCATQKGHTGSFMPDQIKNAAEAATIKGKEVRARLKELLEIGRASCRERV